MNFDKHGTDQMDFHRRDGLYRYYNLQGNRSLGSPIRAGGGYTTRWGSITRVNLD